MSQKTKIQWVDHSLNLVTGCNKLSAGCKNCYAERLALRLQGQGQAKYKNGFLLTVHDTHYEFGLPAKWPPGRIFLCSMSDFLHALVPTAFIQKTLRRLAAYGQHKFLILTKRSNRLKELESLGIPDNFWVGVTCEGQETLYRLDDLRKIEAPIRFVSFEPLLEPIGTPDLKGIDWCIVGGETQFGCRLMEEEWIHPIFDECRMRGIPFFFKQWGWANKDHEREKYRGREWHQWPDEPPEEETA